MNREDKKSLMREKITGSVFELLKNKSLDQITSDEICKAAAVSKKTLYAYYGTKEQMYLAVIKYCFECMNQQMMKVELGQVLDRERNESLEVDKMKVILEKLGRALLEFYTKYPDEGRLVSEFNETAYAESYPIEITEIQYVANQFEPFSLFEMLGADPAVFTKELALTLWSHLYGFSQLLIQKGEWMQSYYSASYKELINRQLDMMMKMIDASVVND